MTTYDYYVTMKTTGIADLKARLSEYLRMVRGGDTVVVLDRQTPVAQIVPVEDAPPLSVRSPSPDAPKLSDIPRPAKRNLQTDVVDLLLEDRASGR